MQTDPRLVSFRAALDARPVSPFQWRVVGVALCLFGVSSAGSSSTGLGWALGVGRIGSVAGPVLAGVLIGYGVPGGTLFRLCMIPAIASAAALFFVRGPADEPRGGERAGALRLQAAHGALTMQAAHGALTMQAAHE